MTALGIDPGLNGAIALVSKTGVHTVWDMPTVEISYGKKSRRIVDGMALIDLLDMTKTMYDVDTAYVEKSELCPVKA